jgi:uncharacterized protein YbcV (DUF1398 family)
MNTTLIHETSQKVLAGTASFPEAVRALLAAGVEYYHIDYATLRKSYYDAEGCVVATPLTFEGLPPVAEHFDAPALKAALLDSQRHGQHYRDFSRRALAAGVQSYFAFLRGQRVVYLGRQGDLHTEWFPGAVPRVSAA